LNTSVTDFSALEVFLTTTYQSKWQLTSLDNLGVGFEEIISAPLETAGVATVDTDGTDVIVAPALDTGVKTAEVCMKSLCSWFWLSPVRL